MDDVDNVLRTWDCLSVPALALLRAMDHNRSRVAAENGVSISELRALTRIAEVGSITPKLLAQSLEMTTGAVTAISNHLVALNMLTRVPHPRDRRSLLLVLTPAAQQTAQRLHDEFQTLFAHAARNVTPDVQARLGSLLTSMAVAITSDSDVSAAKPTA
ncbi:MarR family winged helix-turn-helix transcriptional regulator [Cryobacterium sp. Hz9]|uniref:MarR family winged helix-turn-helix transcriptional regulator n=1 Tax=Cryobacterium sp. Hz9 TaxID=1259167 RepID=UPI00106C0FC4|nr:MarR family transcriptional regulator [Cryobacterium sp. Hz9]TFB70943.1 MarR family transcriptional regulator [Cryobacterium sp. Hz9]